jgi:hypothetical protein
MDPLSVARLLCDARVQAVLEDETGGLVGVSAMRREPAPWLVRLVRHRDKTCRFPGCDARRFTQVHHIEFWSQGGRTAFENSLLLCWLHHRLVHEHGWRVRRRADGVIRWFWPDGTPLRRGRSPDEEERHEIGRRVEVTRARYGFIHFGPSGRDAGHPSGQNAAVPEFEPARNFKGRTSAGSRSRFCIGGELHGPTPLIEREMSDRFA